jgi:hypothetical protein
MPQARLPFVVSRHVVRWCRWHVHPVVDPTALQRHLAAQNLPQGRWVLRFPAWEVGRYEYVSYESGPADSPPRAAVDVAVRRLWRRGLYGIWEPVQKISERVIPLLFRALDEARFPSHKTFAL